MKTTTWSPATPLGFALLLLDVHLKRARRLDDRGASAIEWVVISALLIAIALAVGVTIRTRITDKATTLNLDTP